MGFFDIFKSTSSKFKKEVQRFSSMDTLEAFIGANLLMCVAETKTAPTKENISDVSTRVKATPCVQQYKHSDIDEIIQKYTSMFKNAGYGTAKLEVQRILEVISEERRDAENVIKAVISEAERDGNISPNEEQMLEWIGDQLRLDPANYID